MGAAASDDKDNAIGDSFGAGGLGLSGVGEGHGRVGAAVAPRSAANAAELSAEADGLQVQMLSSFGGGGRSGRRGRRDGDAREG